MDKMSDLVYSGLRFGPNGGVYQSIDRELSKGRSQKASASSKVCLPLFLEQQAASDTRFSTLSFDLRPQKWPNKGCETTLAQ